MFHPDLLCLKNTVFKNLGILMKSLGGLFFPFIEIFYENRISVFTEIFINFVHWSQENLTKVTVLLSCPKCQRNIPRLCCPLLGNNQVSFVRGEGKADARINTSVAINHLSLARLAEKLKFMAGLHVSRTKLAALSVLPLLCSISLEFGAAHREQKGLNKG